MKTRLGAPLLLSLLLALVAAAAFALIARLPGAGAKKPPPEYREEEMYDGESLNVVLVDVTCLRAGNLSCSGYRRRTSPFIDFAATKGIWFRAAFSQAYWTLPSVASLFTSKYAPSHEVTSRDRKLSASHVTLAQTLRKAGYRTGAFVGGLDLASIHNLGQGFDTYVDDTGNKPMGSLAGSLPKALDWLQQKSRAPFFLFVQGYDLHPPLTCPAAYEELFDAGYDGALKGMTLDYDLLRTIDGGKSSRGTTLDGRDIAHVVARYDGALSYVNMLLRDFFLRLRDAGLLSRTIIVIVGDHGEALGDRGHFDRYGRAELFDEIVHVPFIIVHPHLKGVRIDRPVELIDVAPTVLGLLGIPKGEGMAGENLFPLILDEVPENPGKCVFSGWGDRQMVRTSRWKLVFDRGALALYDTRSDPGERENVIAKNRGVGARLAKRLFHWYVSVRAAGGEKKTELTLDQIPRFLRERELIRLTEERRMRTRLRGEP